MLWYYVYDPQPASEGPRCAVVRLLGDRRHFEPVAYGNALGAARAIEPGVDMQTTMRQKTEWQARATEDLRAGCIRAGLDAYNRNGPIRRRKTQAEASAGIVAEWKAIERGGVDRDGAECGIETLTNAERIELYRSDAVRKRTSGTTRRSRHRAAAGTVCPVKSGSP